MKWWVSVSKAPSSSSCFDVKISAGVFCPQLARASSAKRKPWENWRIPCVMTSAHAKSWADVITHGMRQFSHGLRLAELARANCGQKTPALILTSKQDELEGAFETDTHHFIVVCLPRYLREADSNEAIAYL